MSSAPAKKHNKYEAKTNEFLLFKELHKYLNDKLFYETSNEHNINNIQGFKVLFKENNWTKLF